MEIEKKKQIGENVMYVASDLKTLFCDFYSVYSKSIFTFATAFSYITP
jgi:hypothetical protein